MQKGKDEYNWEKTDYSFKDLFEIEEIQKIQDAFSKATGVGTLITEPDGTPITKASGFTKYCNMIRSSEKGLMNCMHSDAVIGKPKMDGPTVQRCLSSGLFDCGASIMIGDKHIACWLLGQVMDENSDSETLVEYAKEVGIEQTLARKYVNEINKISKEKFEAISEFLYLNAKQLSKLAVQNAIQKEEIKIRKRMEIQLEKERKLYEVTVDSIGDAIITTDKNKIITNLNKMARELTGWNKEEAIGISIDNILDIKYKKNSENILLKEDTILISKNGKHLNISETVASIKDNDGNNYGAVLVFRDVTEEKRQIREIEYLSFHDKLTNLYNRAFFENEILKIEKNDSYPVSFIVGDVNGLKLVNDIFGHDEGDKLLISIGKTLLNESGENAIVTRWGGDEFAVILPGVSNLEATRICNKIRKHCVNEIGNKIEPSIALGVASKEKPNQNVRSLIRKAEDRMYRNKLMERKSSRSGTVESLKSTLFERSYETEEHALRLVDISIKIGNKIGLADSEMDELKLSAMLHDIGKVGIMDAILNKPGKLTKEEFEEMKKHSEIGFRIAQSSYEISHIAQFILCHHERWDGSGYPQGLKADSIPLLSRIVAIADAFDAMTNTRLYKEKIQTEKALEEIKNCAGKQFDPNLAEIFTKII